MRNYKTGLQPFSLILVFFMFTSVFMTPAIAADLTLSWDPNSEFDLAGYKVYYKTGFSGAPYDGVNADQGNSEITIPLENLSDPDNPRFSLSGLSEDAMYYLVVSAYNEQGSESGYSNEVSYTAESTTASIYTTTALAGANGSLSPVGATTVNAGSSQTCTITPDPDYQIADVVVDGASVGPVTAYTFSDVAGNHTIAAAFEIDTANPYTITASAGANGSLSPAGATTVNAGSSQTYTIMPDPDYQIADVVVDGASVGPATAYAFQNVTRNHAVTASFEAAGQPPVADAGPDQVVEDGIVVTLSGANSFDLDDGIASYQWQQISGTDVVFSSSDDSETSFPAPSVGQDGETLIFCLNVTDYDGAVSSDICMVNVTWHNTPPKADAGLDVNVDPGSTVVLSAAGSVDTDSGIDGYEWIQTGGVPIDLSDEASVKPGFTAPATAPAGASLNFQLTVTDKGGLQAMDTIIVNVCDLNKPPLAVAGSDQSVDEQALVTLDGSGSSDPDDGLFSYRWHQVSGPPVTLSDATATIATFTAPFSEGYGQTLGFILTVTDNSGLQHSDACAVTVNPQEIDTISPSILITSPGIKWNYYFTWKTSMDMAGSASDNTGVSRVTWSSSRGGSGIASGTTQWAVNDLPVQRGVNVVTVTAENHAGQQTSQTINIYRFK